MIFFALLATSNAACQGLTESPLSRACIGPTTQIVRLGDPRTTPCEDQCNDHLSGRSGCCMQGTDGPEHHSCYVYVGGDAEGIRVESEDALALGLPLRAVYCPAAETPGCRTGISDSKLGQSCGHAGDHVRLGDWRTRSCEDQCNDYLAGSEGCCYQKTNKAHCYVVKASAGVMVKPAPTNLQAVYCPAVSKQGCRTGISDSKLGQSCGHNGVHVKLGDWRTRSCEDQCNDFLSGREGCCYQKSEGRICNVVLGGSSAGVMVQKPASADLQAVYCPAADATLGCNGISESALGRSCGHNGVHVKLGDWRTRSCEDQCNDFLSGRAGCCYQKTNEMICNVVLGGGSAGIRVHQPATDNLQAVYCPAAERPGCNGISESRLGQSCGHNGVQVRLGDWNTRSCEDLCNDYLAGREGCCYQKTTRKAHCIVVLGGDAEGVMVQPAPVNLQAVYCPADERRRQELVHERLEMLELSHE